MILTPFEFSKFVRHPRAYAVLSVEPDGASIRGWPIFISLEGSADWARIRKENLRLAYYVPNVRALTLDPDQKMARLEAKAAPLWLALDSSGREWVAAGTERAAASLPMPPRQPLGLHLDIPGRLRKLGELLGQGRAVSKAPVDRQVS